MAKRRKRKRTTPKPRKRTTRKRTTRRTRAPKPLVTKARLRDKFGRFIKAGQTLIPPVRDSKGRFLSIKAKPLSDEAQRLLERLVVAQEKVAAALANPVIRNRLRRTFAAETLREKIAEEKKGQLVILERFLEQQKMQQEIIDDMDDDPQNIKRWTRAELIEAFGDFYEDDPGEFWEMIVYGEVA